MLEDEELKLLRQEVGEKELWVESMKNE